jgi:hypothetical protein
MSHDEILPMPGQIAADSQLRPWIVVEDQDQVALFRIANKPDGRLDSCQAALK